MELNSRFDQRVLVRSDQLPWQPSPSPGVDRRMLDRIGGEVARATSIVRYRAGHHFSAHRHGGGEEFLVLDGVFQDEHGDYPAGTYVRNPPGTAHTSGSETGCTLFVKLWQFDLSDRVHQRLSLSEALVPIDDGLARADLHADGREQVCGVQLDAGRPLVLDAAGGLELLVLAGSVLESGLWLQHGDWLRLPIGSNLQLRAGDQGARVWVKTGHLRYVAAPHD